MSGYDHVTPDEVVPALHDYAALRLPSEPQPGWSEPSSAEAIPAEASALPDFVAELEASLGDSFPMAPPAAAPAATHAPVARPLPGWPSISAPKHAAGPETRELEPVGLADVAHKTAHETAPFEPAVHQPVASHEMEAPAASTPTPSVAASAGGAATAAAP